MWLKKTVLWIEDKWIKFEAWVNSWLPGFKTRIVTGLGAIGMAAASLQEYLAGLTGLPPDVVSGTTISIASLILFTLSFWLRGLGDRVDARVSGANT